MKVNNPGSEYCQRWRNHQHSWRHTSEGGFDKTQYEVALIPDDASAKAFVEAQHYSRSYPSARLRSGLYHGDDLVGVAVYGTPMQEKVLTNSFPGMTPYYESIELSRFVLLDEVPANAESWFLKQSFRDIADEGIRGVVAFADPAERKLADGTVLFPGHVGTIYQAHNGWHTAERGTPRTLLIAPDGRVFSSRSIQKIRAQERGHEYGERLLVEWGATPKRPGEVPVEWLRHAIEEAGIHRVRHPGNFRYLFPVGRTRGERSRVVFGMESAPYPKKEVVAA